MTGVQEYFCNRVHYQIDIMEEFFDDVRLLASFIGCPIFEKQEKTKMKNGENLFHIKVRDWDAHDIFNEIDHSMRILKGSLLPQSTVLSYRDGEKRNAIIAAMSKPTRDGFWELQRDYVLASSAATEGAQERSNIFYPSIGISVLMLNINI